MQVQVSVQTLIRARLRRKIGEGFGSCCDLEASVDTGKATCPATSLDENVSVGQV